MKIDARLTFDTVPFDQTNKAHLVLEASAPEVGVGEKRPPLCIVTAIDLSTSMQHNRKLEYAKKSLIKLIDHLSPNDYCGVVTFSSGVEVLAAPEKCSSDFKAYLKKKVGALRSHGMTNISDALLTSFEIANNMDLPAETITRVLLFTDGAANMGSVKDSYGILKLAQNNKGIATISAFGYGEDAQQDMLSSMARQNNGNYAFVEGPDDALSAFGKELGGLLSTYATNLVIEVEPKAGHLITKVVSDVDAEEDALGQVIVKIPDILSGEKRHIVLEVELKEQPKSGPRKVNVFEVGIGYDMLDANLKKCHQTSSTKAKLRFVTQGDHQETPDSELDRIVALAEVVRAQIEAEKFAQQGQYGLAADLMRSLSSNVTSRGLGDLGKVATNIGHKMASRESYVGNTAYLASFQHGATRGVGGTYSTAAMSDLISAGVSTSTSSQDHVSRLFQQDDGSTDAADETHTSVEDMLGDGGIGGPTPPDLNQPAPYIDWTYTWTDTTSWPVTPAVTFIPGSGLAIPTEEAEPEAIPEPEQKTRISQKKDNW